LSKGCLFLAVEEGGQGFDRLSPNGQTSIHRVVSFLLTIDA